MSDSPTAPSRPNLEWSSIFSRNGEALRNLRSDETLSSSAVPLKVNVARRSVDVKNGVRVSSTGYDYMMVRRRGRILDSSPPVLCDDNMYKKTDCVVYCGCGAGAMSDSTDVVCMEHKAAPSCRIAV